MNPAASGSGSAPKASRTTLASAAWWSLAVAGRSAANSIAASSFSGSAATLSTVTAARYARRCGESATISKSTASARSNATSRRGSIQPPCDAGWLETRSTRLPGIVATSRPDPAAPPGCSAIAAGRANTIRTSRAVIPLPSRFGVESQRASGAAAWSAAWRHARATASSIGLAPTGCSRYAPRAGCATSKSISFQATPTSPAWAAAAQASSAAPIAVYPDSENFMIASSPRRRQPLGGRRVAINVATRPCSPVLLSGQALSIS
ncbi:MAG: hypothetical protein KIS72_09815 [Luteimonas sp.]|nr:hypothetical protein [Luteimonas sp.]